MRFLFIFLAELVSCVKQQVHLSYYGLHTRSISWTSLTEKNTMKVRFLIFFNFYFIQNLWQKNALTRVVNLRAGPGRSGRTGPDCPARPGPAEISGRNGPARPAKILGRNGPAQLKSWAGPGRSCPILFLAVFLKDFLKKIWTLLLTHFKLSIILSKKWWNIGEIFAEYWQKTARPGPQKFWAWTARPSPLKFAGRNGPARPGPICQAWDLQPWFWLFIGFY